MRTKLFLAIYHLVIYVSWKKSSNLSNALLVNIANEFHM